VRKGLAPVITGLIVLWRVIVLGAVIIYGLHQGRQDDVQAVSRGGESTPTRPQGRAGLGGDLKVLRGAVEFANTQCLVLNVSEGIPTRHVFGLARATIRVGGKEGDVAHLHRGDVVGVVYMEAHGERMATMVLVPDSDRR
jgi:hypothetical protein